MASNIYLKGLEELDRNCNNIIRDITDAKTKLLLEQANVVKDAIREQAPRGPTGNLKAACYAKAYPETTTSPAVAYAGIRPRKAPHAWNVIHGHGGPHPAPPHDFFTPAWESVKESVNKAIKDGLAVTIKNAV
jgi:HK97 gp10 family phage protein